MFDIDKIDECFPLPSYRPGQRTAIQRVAETFNSGCKVVFLEAPTGSGKSAIGYTLAQMVDSAYYLAPQKFLQDQLTADFGEFGKHCGTHPPMMDLKGRNAYKCNFWHRALVDPSYDWGSTAVALSRIKHYHEVAAQMPGCDRGECKRDGKSRLPYCVNSGQFCPYLRQVYQCQSSKICLMNFHSFLFQTSIVHQFGSRQLLILDEAHGTEDVLLKFVELKISDRHFQHEGIKFPKFNSVLEYVNFFLEIQLEDLIAKKVEESMRLLDSRAEEEWKSLLLKYNLLLEADPDEWVCIWEQNQQGTNRTITLKPIYIDKFAQQYLFNFCDYVLMMSATILSKQTMCEALGIKQENKLFRMPCNFPAVNRPVKLEFAGSMSYSNKAATFPKLIQAVNDICKRHQNERGIIHTHTFEICQELLNKCDPAVRSRFLYQRDEEFDGNKHIMLQKHATIPNSVIIAPAMHEGLDLKDDLARFQIICKIPYPAKGDPQIAARMELSYNYYNWRTAVKIIQSYGRICRHDKDFGVTYIIDSDYRRFQQSSAQMLPKWFLDAVS